MLAVFALDAMRGGVRVLLGADRTDSDLDPDRAGLGEVELEDERLALDQRTVEAHQHDLQATGLEVGRRPRRHLERADPLHRHDAAVHDVLVDLRLRRPIGLGADQRVRTLRCTEHYRVMAFAQLTYRESLRDIEACLSAQAAKLYHMGFREPIRRSTLADANERRDWRIYADFAQRLIAQARRLYANEDLGLELTNTVYALDSTTLTCACRCFLGHRSAPPR